MSSLENDLISSWYNKNYKLQFYNKDSFNLREKTLKTNYFKKPIVKYMTRYLRGKIAALCQHI